MLSLLEAIKKTGFTRSAQQAWRHLGTIRDQIAAVGAAAGCWHLGCHIVYILSVGTEINR